MKILFTFLNLIFLTVILYFCVTIMYSRIDISTFEIPDLSKPLDNKIQDTSQDTKKISQTRYSTITARNLFKASIAPDKKEKDIPGPETDVDQLAKTQLNLKLWGTVAGIGSQSFAVIQEQTGNTQTLYHEGDSVAKALIKKILRSSVVLNYNGEDQILEMETSTPRGQASPSPLSPPLKSQNSPLTMSIEKSVLDDAMADMDTLVKQVRVRPHFSKGQPDGLLIYGIKNNTLFNKLGLKNGDILMGIDDKDINSMGDALSLYQGLSQASEAKIKLKRRGQIKEINYNVQQ